MELMLIIHKRKGGEAQILQGLNYKVCSIISLNFLGFGLFILVLTACCCNATRTSEKSSKESTMLACDKTMYQAAKLTSCIKTKSPTSWI